MSFPILRWLRLAALLAPAVALCAAEKTARPPNVVFILADDLGYGDVGAYGQKQIRTPNIDRLAAEGIRFTDAYAGAPVCAPSRCALMTGRHTGHARIRGNAGQAAIRDPLGLALQPEDNTLGKVMKSAGYATAAIGKWGMGYVGAEAMGLPTRQGFDYFFGYLNQAHAHNSYPSFLWRNEEKVPLPNLVPNEGPFGTGVSSNKVVHSEDLFITEALKFVRAQKDRPFFLYFASTLPHANNESKPLGLEIPSLGDYNRSDWPEAERRFAAMVTRIDTDVGRLLALLKELGLEDNTIVIFTSDNGPHKEGGQDPRFFDSAGNLRGIKRDVYDGGIREPMIVRWPGHAPAGRVDTTPWYFPDVLPTLADIVGQPAPQSDGVSVRKLFSGQAQPELESRPLYWEFYEGGFRQSARLGFWKAVMPRLGAPIELYDLRKDMSEAQNVAERQPAVVAQFAQFLKDSHTDSPTWPVRAKPRKGAGNQDE
jgi:arylsulfatase A-like enzyme